MPEKESILAELDARFNKLLSAVEGLSEEQMTKAWLGTWGVREILIHIAGWMREITGAMARMAQGLRPTAEGVDYSDFNGWNARFVQEKGDAPPAQVVEELRNVYNVYRAVVAALPEERFAPGRALDRMLHASGIDHCQEHAAQIREWRQKEGV